MTVRNGEVLTKQIFAGDMRIASKLVPNPADEQCTTCTDGPSVVYFHSDHLGSTGFVTDATQALVGHEEYFRRGKPRGRAERRLRRVRTGMDHFAQSQFSTLDAHLEVPAHGGPPPVRSGP